MPDVEISAADRARLHALLRGERLPEFNPEPLEAEYQRDLAEARARVAERVEAQARARAAEEAAEGLDVPDPDADIEAEAVAADFLTAAERGASAAEMRQMEASMRRVDDEAPSAPHAAEPLTAEPFPFQPKRPKPVIHLVKGSLHDAVDEAVKVLSDPDLGVFARGPSLVRVVDHTPPNRTLAINRRVEGNVERPSGAIVLDRLETDSLVEVLTGNASFMKYDGRAKNSVSVDCPPEVARTVLARRGHRWTIPRLRAVIQAPTLRDDGTVLAEPGYDAATGLLLVSETLWPKVDDAPTKRDALDALDRLIEPIDLLPFVGNEDRAAAVALMMTAVLRPILRTAPMFAVTVPAAGTGKSLTVDVASILATGRPAAVVTPTPDEAELEKRIGAAALAGDAILNIDNVTHVLRSDQLCQMLTQEEVQVRVLGRSENIKIPSTGLIACTGNNLSLYGDLNRRAIVIRLDARCERPDERRFTFEPLAMARRRRREYVTAALTIAKAYLAAGTPNPPPPMGSFEDWSALVRGSLMWVSLADCRGGADELRREDPEKVELAEIMAALPDGEFTVKDIARRSAYDEDLRATLGRFLERGGFSSKRFGQFLRRHKNTPVGGREIVLVRSDPSHGSTWIVASCEGRSPMGTNDKSDMGDRGIVGDRYRQRTETVSDTENDTSRIVPRTIPRYPPIPQRPTPADKRRARALVERLIGEALAAGDEGLAAALEAGIPRLVPTKFEQRDRALRVLRGSEPYASQSTRAVARDLSEAAESYFGHRYERDLAAGTAPTAEPWACLYRIGSLGFAGEKFPAKDCLRRLLDAKR